MNYPLLTILITKIYMIYNSNFIYTWQLLDQVRDRFTWPQLEELHNQSDPGTGKILKPLMLPVNLVILSVWAYASRRPIQLVPSSKTLGGGFNYRYM